MLKKQYALLIADANRISVALSSSFVCRAGPNIQYAVNVKPSAILPLQLKRVHVTFSIYAKHDLHVSKRMDRPTFERELQRSLKYFFWSKCEWEVLISPWCEPDKDKAIKVDVCWQVMLNWDKFAAYVWEHTHRNIAS